MCVLASCSSGFAFSSTTCGVGGGSSTGLRNRALLCSACCSISKFLLMASLRKSRRLFSPENSYRSKPHTALAERLFGQHGSGQDLSDLRCFSALPGGLCCHSARDSRC